MTLTGSNFVQRWRKKQSDPIRQRRCLGKTRSDSIKETEEVVSLMSHDRSRVSEQFLNGASAHYRLFSARNGG